MATDSWINETLYPDWGQRFRIVRELARERSAFQDIVVFESASHGRVMVLDGVIQITERDEFAYQEMLAHVPLLAHGSARSVLVIAPAMAACCGACCGIAACGARSWSRSTRR